MTQGILFRSLLCCARQQVMGNKPSRKTREMVSLKRMSYNGYYSSLPSWRREFDSHYPLKWGCGVVVTRCKTVNLLRFHTAYNFASKAWTRGSIPLIPAILWCSSEAEQGAVNSQVGISEFPITAKTMVFPIQRMSTIQSGIGIQHPQPGPRENSEEAVKIGTRRVSHHCFIWPVSLSVRTHPFHGWETSSILVRATLEV